MKSSDNEKNKRNGGSVNSDKMLKRGCSALSWWSYINFFLSSLILIIVVSGLGNSPLLSMVFIPSEVAELSPKTIGALNTLTILYNSYAAVMSVMVWFVTRNALRKKARWAFWALLITIGFAEIFAFIASAPFNHTRWQVNVVLSLLYITGMFLTGLSLRRTHVRTE